MRYLTVDNTTENESETDTLWHPWLNNTANTLQGIGSNFGDFLMDLDDLTEMIEGRGSKKQVFASDLGGDGVSDDESPDVVLSTSHLIADDEQEQ